MHVKEFVNILESFVGVIEMIQSKKDLEEWLHYEGKGFNNKLPEKLISEPFHYQRLLRKTEYYRNCRKDILGKMIYFYCRTRMEKESQRLGISIPCNVFDKGLRIVHYGSVTVNQGCKVGKNCRIYNNTVLGTLGAGFEEGCPTIGDNVFIGSNSCVLGNIKVGDNVVIAAGAVVICDVPDNVTVAGVPAKIVKQKGWIYTT